MLDIIFPKEILDSSRESVYNLSASIDCFAVVVAKVVKCYSVLIGLFYEVQNLRISEERFTGYTTPVETHTTNRIAFDDGCIES